MVRVVARAVSALVGCALVGCALMGCAADDVETVESGLGYTLEFPSKQAAIATESLKVYVFDASQDCTTLMQSRRAGGVLPTALAETAAAPLCDYISGAAGLEIELDANDYVVFAVAQRENLDMLLGCARQRVDTATEHTPVVLTLADETRPIPTTNCALVADKCGGRC